MGAKTMSTNINPNALKNFIVKTIGANHLTEKTAQKHGIDANKFEEANVDENQYLELDEIIQNSDLYEQFATLYVEEQDKKTAAKDEEQEKEDQRAVKDKNGAGV